MSANGVCNLSEVNVSAFVKEENERKYIDLQGLSTAVDLAARIGLRMTNVTLELPEWDAVQKRDRLTGVSMTGYVEAMDAVGVDSTSISSLVPVKGPYHTDIDFMSLDSFLRVLNTVANTRTREYAAEMRVTAPLLTTALKPSGTISQLPTVSSGAHASYAPYYIRRVRISSFDPLAKTMLEVGYPVYPEASTMLPEVFEKLSTFEKMRVLDSAQTWVIEFPVKTSATRLSSEESAVEQLNRYFILQNNYTDHNTSITVTFDPAEVDAIIDLLLERWDEYIGVSFLPKMPGSYPLMPYEAITEEQYIARRDAVANISWADISSGLILRELVMNADDELDADCVGGACPVR